MMSADRSARKVLSFSSSLMTHALINMKVGLFVTCLVDLMRPRIGFAALELLKAAGCEVVVPETQTCCGQPGYNSGDRASAVALARKVAREFADCEYVVVPSGSCAGMMRTHYPDLLKDVPEAERAALQALAERTYELTDFLVNIARYRHDSKSSIKSYTYHDSCSGCVNSASNSSRAHCWRRSKVRNCVR